MQVPQFTPLFQNYLSTSMDQMNYNNPDIAHSINTGYYYYLIQRFVKDKSL